MAYDNLRKNIFSKESSLQSWKHVYEGIEIYVMFRSKALKKIIYQINNLCESNTEIMQIVFQVKYRDNYWIYTVMISNKSEIVDIYNECILCKGMQTLLVPFDSYTVPPMINFIEKFLKVYSIIDPNYNHARLF